MGEGKSVEFDTRELGTVVRDCAGLLLVYAHAIQHMADLEGGRDSLDHRTRVAIASQLQALAQQLDVLGDSLCEMCRLTEMAEYVSVRKFQPGSADEQSPPFPSGPLPG